MKQHPQHHLGLRLYDYQTNRRRRARARYHRLLYLAGTIAIISLIAASRV